jgi:YfiH family protein
MNLNFKNSVGFLTFPAFSKFPFVKHCFTTRIGGISRGIYKSMNLGFSNGDSTDNVIENYKILCNAVGFKLESLVASAQNHETYIRNVTKKDKGVGILRPRDIDSVDGLVTNEKGITLSTYYADCVPLFFLDPVKRVIALAHAGWRGTVSKIAEKMVFKMKSDYGCCAQDIIVGIGPSIGACCYEVSCDVAKKFMELQLDETSKILKEMPYKKYKLDLWEANRQILIKSGIEKDNIWVTDLCTNCNHDLLISHRYTKGKRGVMAAMMCLI